MTPAKDAELRAKFPRLFSGLDEPIRCGDGWYDLLFLACAGLDALVFWTIDINGDIDKQAEPYRLTCVKEKFGALELYTGNMCCYHLPGFKELYDLVWRLSLTTCDVCGKPGQKRGGAPLPDPWWVRTRCNDHISWREGETGFAHKTEP